MKQRFVSLGARSPEIERYIRECVRPPRGTNPVSVNPRVHASPFMWGVVFSRALHGWIQSADTVHDPIGRVFMRGPPKDYPVDRTYCMPAEFRAAVFLSVAHGYVLRLRHRRPGVEVCMPARMSYTKSRTSWIYGAEWELISREGLVSGDWRELSVDEENRRTRALRAFLLPKSLGGGNNWDDTFAPLTGRQLLRPIIAWLVNGPAEKFQAVRGCHPTDLPPWEILLCPSEAPRFSIVPDEVTWEKIGP